MKYFDEPPFSLLAHGRKSIETRNHTMFDTEGDIVLRTAASARIPTAASTVRSCGAPA